MRCHAIMTSHGREREGRGTHPRGKCDETLAEAVPGQEAVEVA